MQFPAIDKTQYGKRLKITFFAICIYMLIVALGISSLLIALIGANQGDNFWLNVAGVIIAALGLALIYKKVKSHPYLKDIIYVRALKGQMNRIYRRQRQLKTAAESGDVKAMSILEFSYAASEFVYKLDDNTLTLEELAQAQQQLRGWAENHNLDGFPEYDQNWLSDY
ncbi:MAG: hypothetical protein OFPI_18390 [Osedax symbiont Rs2]|nr:MAG: hypothetical protein OFPI_18390 [Osedax symbiont Rs2]